MSNFSYAALDRFEQALALYTGAPYAVMTDCCTHAIELCLRFCRVSDTAFPCRTYLSIPQTMHKLGIQYTLTDAVWRGEYQFENTSIWDSAQKLEPGMYKPKSLQCLSFGYGKPLSIGGGGAILLDNKEAYDRLIKQRFDGRDLSISPWIEQKTFEIGYHYRPTVEQAELGLKLLASYTPTEREYSYPDLRTITIND